LVRATAAVGHHPQELRIGRTIALRKPGRIRATAPKDYRPITMLVTLSKIIEKFMAGCFVSYLEPDIALPTEELTMSEGQFGFRPARSCEQASAQLINKIRMAKRRNNIASVVFLDIAGAYDTVLPSMLLAELVALKMPANLIRWV
jgi:hypothetical protein